MNVIYKIYKNVSADLIFQKQLEPISCFLSFSPLFVFSL